MGNMTVGDGTQALGDTAQWKELPHSQQGGASETHGESTAHIDPRLASLVRAQKLVTSPSVQQLGKTAVQVGGALLSRDLSAISTALFSAVGHLGDIQQGVVDIKHALDELIAAAASLLSPIDPDSQQRHSTALG